MKMAFLCEVCGANFNRSFGLNRHLQSVHRIELSKQCRYCDRLILKKDLELHMKCEHQDKQFVCLGCTNKFSNKRNRDIHKCTSSLTQNNSAEPVPVQISNRVVEENSQTPGPSYLNGQGYRCSQCGVSFSNRHELYVHKMRAHMQRGAGFLQPTPYIQGQEPWIDNEPLGHIYDTNSPLILQRHQEGSVFSIYNIPLTNDFSIHEIMESMEEIYDRQQHAFRLNLNFGLILVNTETGEYRYFRPFSNQSLFQRPIYVSRRHDLSKLRKRLERLNIVDYILQQRPDTKWKPVLVTNVHFHLFYLNYLLGAPLQLPDYITANSSVVVLDKRRKDGQLYNDNLCAFRCLATHHHRKEKRESNTKHYFNCWVSYLQLDVSQEDFEGVSLYQMADFEKCFSINVNIYDLKKDGLAQSIYKSRCQFSETMQLNMYQHHLSYISNFNAYATKYQCRTCDRHFNDISNMYKHQRICTGRTVHQFPGGFYTAPKSIFDKLCDFGIIVPKKDRLFPWFLVYDFEAMLLPVQGEGSEKLKWTSKHVPISVSVCSNVENYTTPHCIVNPDIDVLVKEMVDHMECIAAAGAEIAREKFKRVYEELEAKINDPVADLGFEDREPTADEVSDRAEALSDLQEELDAYCKQMVCLGFNSANYDLNLIKSHIAKYLNLDQVNLFTVKRNNQYACLATNTLKFLDITSYLSPGINYAKFLKAFDVVEDKGFFPYDWLDDIEKLEYPQLPPHAAFYSALKDHNISKEEYSFCQKVWEDNGMCTFKDFLVWYNNLDVGPFVTAVQNLQKYYFERQIDIFKVSISVPGLARQMLFKCGRQAGASFALCNDNNKDLYYTIKDNIIGGPSIIFNRYHETGITNIRNNPSKPCKKIVGFDANALYLFCIGQPMPTGPFVRRRLEEQFKPNKTEKYMLAYHWLNWLNQSNGLNIQHKLNQGQEKKVGKYPVDGFDEDSNTIYQFHGCYWHGHRCWLTKSQHGKEKWEATADKRAKKTQEVTNFLKCQGYKVVEMRECSFRTRMRFNTRLKAFVDAQQPPTPQRQMTEQEILQAVINNTFFGMVEVDIKVPEEWPDYFKHPTMTPYQYFQEMSPIFCTTEVSHDVMGEHMQDYLKEFELSTNPRRLLVGGMSAEKILLATPLLKWYLEHGLVVTKIYQTVEFQPMRCFKQFVRDVSDARRAGDSDPSKAIIADTRKLEGNSAFGSTIMDQEKFNDVTYVKGEGPARLEANLPQFKQLTQLIEEEEYYEVEKAKSSIKLNLPVQIGYFILQYGKLHMLQFYYDFLDKFVDRSDFEYCEMDTDSAYMALAGPDFDSVIKPEMKEAYQHGLRGYCKPELEIEADCLHHWFPRTCCSEHSKFDKRTPGLFKIEYEGDSMISLCSKTYIVAKRVTKITPNTVLTAASLLRRAKKLKPKRLQPKHRTYNEIKFSSKGISKKTVTAPLTIFKQVLKTKRPGSGFNKGLRARNNTIYTYTQQRCGFSYFYCKRKVLADGRTTVPLDLILRPGREKCEDVTESETQVSGDYSQNWDLEDENNVHILNALLEESL